MNIYVYLHIYMYMHMHMDILAADLHSFRSVLRFVRAMIAGGVTGCVFVVHRLCMHDSRCIA